jgi:predicted transcriptional regulator
MQPLDLDSRRRLYAIVRDNPGLHFREIQRMSGQSVSVAGHHLHYLTKHGLIKVENDRRFLRYYPLHFSTEDARAMSLLRQGSARRIISELLMGECTFSGLQARTRLSAASISEHLKRMEALGIIGRDKAGTYAYRILDEGEIIQLLIVYKESFVDRIVDRVLETWEF